MANVSLLLPSFKRPHLLDLGLFSISQQPTIHNLEILVLNDGVEDETETICNSFPSLNVKYIFTGQRNKDSIKKRVPGFALNIGLRRCAHDIVVLSCPEMFHLNQTIDTVVRRLLEAPKSMVIPEFIYFDKSQETTNSLLRSRNNPIDINKLVGGAYGACHVEMPFLMALYKKEIIDIGGYDEDFIGYAGEDCDLIERLKLAGLTHSRTPAQAIHLWHEGSTDGACHFENPDWVINWDLLQGRKGIKDRNVGREWGVLDA